jgi:hypothetical protein
MRQIVNDQHYNNIPLIKKLNPKIFDYTHDIITKL